MKRFFLCFLLSCSMCFSASAQNMYLQVVNAYFTSTGGTPITNLIDGDTIEYHVTIMNLDSNGGTAFSGLMSLGCIINPGSSFSLALYPNPQQQVNIPSLDTVELVFRDSVTLGRYGGGGGGGTVVIWPVTNNILFVPIDSFSVPFIYKTVSIVNPNSVSRWNIYPNPTQDVLYINNIEPENGIEYVRIFNAMGVLLKEKKDNCTEIDVSDLTQGIYFLVVRDKSEKQGIFKIVVGQ